MDNCQIIELSRPPSVRVDHGYSILVVCLAGTSATMTVKTDALNNNNNNNNYYYYYYYYYYHYYII